MAHSVAIASLAGKFDPRDKPWFDFELKWPSKAVEQWLRTNIHLSYCVALLYIATVFTAQRFMVNKPPFNLRRVMVVWNLFLAIFSGFISIRCCPIYAMKVQQQTFYGLICDASGSTRIPQVFIWLDLFVFFKIVEFFDTAFIVLRKQKLSFIHWFHHATVLIIAWHSFYSDPGSSNGGGFMCMNAVVHTFMYSYYAFRAAQIPVPRVVSMTITTLQIAQMFAGLFLSLSAAYFMLLRNDRPCDDAPEHVLVALAVYLSYTLLFCQFFCNTYLSKPKKFAKTD